MTLWVAAALASLSVAAAPAGDEPATSLRALFDGIDRDLDGWDLPAARTHLTDVESVMEGQPDLRPLELMRGKVDFFEGHYDSAVHHFVDAGADIKVGSFPQLARDALEETRDDVVRDSEHFRIAVPRGPSEVLVPYALETLEKAYAALREDLQFAPPTPIRVEVLRNDEALAKLSTLTREQIQTTGTIAICKFNRLMIISPSALIHGYAWRDTLNHELVHLFLTVKTGNTVPIWLHEGLAKFEESRWRGAPGQAMTSATRALLGNAVRHDKLVTFEQMHPSMALLPSQEMAATAFAEVFYAVEFLHQRGGYPLLNRILADLRDGEDDEAAVAHAYGAPFGHFVSDWKQFLRGQTYPPIPSGRAGRELAFKPPAGDAIDQTSLDDFGDIADAQARNHAHLGELLRRRRRLNAALIEFRKARANVGDASLALDDDFARALLDSKYAAEAASVLEACDRLFPDVEQTQLHLGLARMSQGDMASARKALEEGLGVDPFDPALHAALVQDFHALHLPELENRETRALALLGGPSGEVGSARAPGPGPDGGPPATLASVLVSSHPFGEIFVDGEPVGRTTPTLLSVPPGVHRLQVVNRERDLAKELEVALIDGENPDLLIELEDPRTSPALDGGSTL